MLLYCPVVMEVLVIRILTYFLRGSPWKGSSYSFVENMPLVKVSNDDLKVF